VLVTGVIASFIAFFGFVLFIVPGVWLSVMFSLAIIIAVTERTSGWKALMRSRAYVSGNWFAVFGRLLIAFVIGALVNSGITFLIPDSNTTLLVVDQLLGSLLGFILAPLGLLYLFFIYEDLKAAAPPPIPE
jgi:hypothetical protein